MSYSEQIELDNEWCDFTQRIGAYHPTPYRGQAPWPPAVQSRACAFPAVRAVLFAAIGIVLCVGLMVIWLFNRARPW
jgi:hypothetical protein